MAGKDADFKQSLDQDHPTEGHSFDELAKGIASGALSRGQLLKLVGVAILGSVFSGTLPEVAVAKKKKKKKKRPPLVPTCPTGSTLCGGKCVTNCSGGELLNPSSCQCECPSGSTLCSGNCVSCTGGLVLNPSTCQCECPSGTTPCSSGGCVPNCTGGEILNPSTCQCECPSGTTLCGGNCITNCTGGQLLNPQSCQCECPSGTTLCNGSCTDLQTDTSNCGACSQVCSHNNGTPSCAKGTCQITCNTGFANCDNNSSNGCETNLQTDTSNCGACGRVCSHNNGTPSCANGTCQITCNTGFANCDNNPLSGCETNVLSDPNNCGTCGHRCNGSAGQICLNSTCCSQNGVVCSNNSDCCSNHCVKPNPFAQAICQ